MKKNNAIWCWNHYMELFFARFLNKYSRRVELFSQVFQAPWIKEYSRLIFSNFLTHSFGCSFQWLMFKFYSIESARLFYILELQVSPIVFILPTCLSKISNFLSSIMCFSRCNLLCTNKLIYIHCLNVTLKIHESSSCTQVRTLTPSKK